MIGSNAPDAGTAAVCVARMRRRRRADVLDGRQAIAAVSTIRPSIFPCSLSDLSCGDDRGSLFVPVPAHCRFSCR